MALENTRLAGVIYLMSRTVTFLLRTLAHTVVFVLLVAVLTAVFLTFRLLSYEQRDDANHLVAKNEYLREISQKAISAAIQPPNFIIVLLDDLGYGDLGVYGGRSISTPNIDSLASGGLRFTAYYSAASVCSPARAALLTGRYPPRAGVPMVLAPTGSLPAMLNRVMGTNDRLPAEEITVASALQSAGYATAAFGKWHLGDYSPSLPNDHGFDEFIGVLHSNDMAPLPLWSNREIIEEHPMDQTKLTGRFTDEAIRFIRQHRDDPFFLYVPHVFPHRPLHASAEQRGRSRGGRYGDIVEDLDRSVGQIVNVLHELNLEENTLVLFTSDNGPWFQGSTGATRGRKMGSFDGGTRVPMIASWPGRISPGLRVDDPVVSVDLFPTILELADIEIPTDRVIDGSSLTGLFGKFNPVPTRPIYYYLGTSLTAVRAGHFKYYDRQATIMGVPFRRLFLQPATIEGPWLFDLSLDGDESYDVSQHYPADFARLRRLFDARNREMHENLRGWQ